MRFTELLQSGVWVTFNLGYLSSMRVVSQSAKETFVNGRRLISIPLPPPRSCLSPKRRVLKNFKAIVTFDREKLVECEDQSHRRYHRKAMGRAFAFSLGINLLVCLLLYFVVFDSREDNRGGENLITVMELVANKETSHMNNVAKDESAPPKSRQEIKPASGPAHNNSNLLAVVSRVPEIEKIPSLELSTFGVAKDPSISDFGLSMTTGDLKKGSGRRSDPFETNNQSSANDDVFGKMPNDVNRFFEAKTIGDGSDLILFLDTSGSMKERSHAVGRYVETNYPKASIVEVRGCHFRGQNPALFQPMLHSRELKTRSQLVFVCDLQDGVDQDGVDIVARFILQEGNRKSFHVISFQKSPHDLVMGLIERSEGSFKRAN